jgi:hypothetical protein
MFWVVGWVVAILYLYLNFSAREGWFRYAKQTFSFRGGNLKIIKTFADYCNEII